MTLSAPLPEAAAQADLMAEGFGRVVHDEILQF
jgi:hypothetical protein